MNRRAFLLGTAGLALAGCARAQPSPAEPSPATSPSGAATGAAVGVEPSATGKMLGALLVTVAQNSLVTTQPTGPDWLAALRGGGLASAPVYASSVWAGLSDSAEPSEDVVSDLAGLVEPEVNVLTPGATEGGLVWMSAPTSGIKSLDDLADWSVGKAAAVPSLALERADGPPGLSAIYRTRFTTIVQDDPVARAKLVATGAAAVGAFRRTDYLGGAALVELADPDKMCVADPLVLLVNAGFAERSPHQVLAQSSVFQTLTNAELNALQAQVAGGASVAEVARLWLAEKGLIK